MIGEEGELDDRAGRDAPRNVQIGISAHFPLGEIQTSPDRMEMDTKHSKIPARRSPCLADLPYLAKDVDISSPSAHHQVLL